MTLSAMGLALTPAGGSVCIRLKSRINLRLAAVDILEAWTLLSAFGREGMRLEAVSYWYDKQIVKSYQ